MLRHFSIWLLLLPTMSIVFANPLPRIERHTTRLGHTELLSTTETHATLREREALRGYDLDAHVRHFKGDTGFGNVQWYIRSEESECRTAKLPTVGARDSPSIDAHHALGLSPSFSARKQMPWTNCNFVNGVAIVHRNDAQRTMSKHCEMARRGQGGQ